MVLSGQALRGKCTKLPAGNVQLKITGVINAGDDFGNEDSIILYNAQCPEEIPGRPRATLFRYRQECVFAKTELSLLTLDKQDFLKIFHQYDSFEGNGLIFSLIKLCQEKKTAH